MSKKMDPEEKAKWVAALRSKEYQQGKFQLRTEPGDEFFPVMASGDKPAFCCLGVANEVLGLGCGPDQADLTKDMGGGQWETVAVPRWAQNILVSMNDNKSMSFAQIADWIEENL